MSWRPDFSTLRVEKNSHYVPKALAVARIKSENVGSTVVVDKMSKKYVQRELSRGASLKLVLLTTGPFLTGAFRPPPSP